MKIYLIGSLRNPNIPHVANQLRDVGYDVFDDWFSPGRTTDDEWQAYEKIRGRTYREALTGYHPEEVFTFDKRHLESSDIGVLLLPAGRSSHLELGYVLGKGKPGYIILPAEPDRFDIMYKFATGICYSVEELVKVLEGPQYEFHN